MEYDWKDAGEEWSQGWGGSVAQWFGAILPRIRSSLPAVTMLEIAPGFGRWTYYLKEYCQHLYVIDSAEECIEACRERFKGDSRLSYYVNDGVSLSMLPEASIDFVFSFDSLVHSAPDVIEAYLQQLAMKLKLGGTGFIHHSNLGEYAHTMLSNMPKPLKRLLMRANVIDREFGRDPTMSAALFRSFCIGHGLRCLSQEIINWRGRGLTDCFSLFVRDGSKTEEDDTRIARNPHFMREAALIRKLARISPALRN